MTGIQTATDRVAAQKSNDWNVPIEIGAIIVVSYLTLRLFWQQSISGSYAFAIERALFLIAVIIYARIRYQWSPTVLLGSFRFPDRSHLRFVVAIVCISMVMRLAIKIYLGDVDHFGLSLSSFIDNCIVAPVNEEFVFRGLVISSLIGAFPRRKWGLILLAALIFTGVHRLYSIAAITLMAMGIVLGILFVRTRSITACVLLHGVWNSAVFLDLPDALNINN